MEWREIPDFDGRYLINRQGDVKRIDSAQYNAVCSRGRRKSSIILKPRIDHEGVAVVRLHYRGVHKWRRVRTLLKKIWGT